MKRLSPTLSSSPGRTRISSATRQPLTKVPFSEPTSRSVQPSSAYMSTACRAETVSSATTKSRRATADDDALASRQNHPRRAWNSPGNQNLVRRARYPRDHRQQHPPYDRRLGHVTQKTVKLGARPCRVEQLQRVENVSTESRSSRQARRNTRATRSLSAADGRTRPDCEAKPEAMSSSFQKPRQMQPGPGRRSGLDARLVDARRLDLGRCRPGALAELVSTAGCLGRSTPAANAMTPTRAATTQNDVVSDDAEAMPPITPGATRPLA